MDVIASQASVNQASRNQARKPVAANQVNLNQKASRCTDRQHCGDFPSKGDYVSVGQPWSYQKMMRIVPSNKQARDCLRATDASTGTANHHGQHQLYFSS